MRTTWLSLLGGLLLANTSLHAQVATPRLDSIARRIVAAARYATFVTVDSAGRPQVRTVQPRSPGAAWDVWFATNPRTRKVREVERRAPVALHYFDPVTESYVAITGRARVVRERTAKDANWDPEWNAFYLDRDKGVVLIAVQAERIEVVSPRLGVDSDATTWRPQSFVPTRRKP
jgi:general stress protein 26